jgi:hypothetical protein
MLLSFPRRDDARPLTSCVRGTGERVACDEFPFVSPGRALPPETIGNIRDARPSSFGSILTVDDGGSTMNPYGLSHDRWLVLGPLFALGVALASTSRPAQAEGPPPLPPEAYAACASKTAGEACVAEVHGTEVHGTCAADRDSTKLFCRPDAPPPPPPEAFDACSGKKAVVSDRDSVAGWVNVRALALDRTGP